MRPAAAPPTADRPRGRDEWARWSRWPCCSPGTVLITMSSQVKLPSLLALGFVAMALACRWGGTFKAFVIASGSLTAVSVAVMAVIGWASGLGFGWLFTLGTANVVRSWMSPPTLLALGTGQVGILLGLGDHTTAVLGADPCHRCDPYRSARHLAAARRVARPAASGRRARRRARGDRAAVPRRPALVPAVGDHPAGGLGHPAGVPRHRDRAHPGRRHLRPDRQRRPVRAVPDRRGDAGERGDRAVLIALTYYRLPWRALPDSGATASPVGPTTGDHRPPAGRLR